MPLSSLSPFQALSPRLRANSRDTEVPSLNVPALWAQQPDVVLKIAETEALLSKSDRLHSSSRSYSLSYGSSHDHEHDHVEPVPPEDVAVPKWQVVGRVAPCCRCWSTRQLELVQFRQANYGLRWNRTDPIESQRAVPSCVMGPQRCFMLTSFSVFFSAAAFVTYLTIVQHASVLEVVFGILISGTCLTLYAILGCRNPGILERITTPTADAFTYCDECQSYRPIGTLHCFECRVCIEDCDHHCPWTGKCIGKRNLRLFYMWLGSLALAFVYEMIEFATYMLPATPLPPA